MRGLTLVFLLMVLMFCACSHKAPETFTNPIIPGGYPDPSIIRVDDTYYLATSSFIWFPGVPIFKSKDLVNWEKIGYALSNPEHFDTSTRPGVHGGAWAPTIRYHEGLFYLTVTQRSSGASIITTATNPAGPWSKPVELHSQKGIDGSLLFDDDGKVWYCWSEDHEILLREFNMGNYSLEGDTVLLLDEHMFGKDYSHIEGPHIYKLDNGEYMLLIASGGTGTNRHNISVFKSSSPKGPYTPNPKNPVLTHWESDSPFENMGHADIVQTQNGEWWAVMLGVRPKENFTIMDRETFLVQFDWEDGWPVFKKHEGGRMVLETDKRPDLPWTPVNSLPATDDFDTPELGLQYNFYRTPFKKWYSLSHKPGALRIYLQPEAMTQKANTPVIARRITQFDFDASAIVTFDPENNETAGLIAIMNERGQMRLEVFVSQGARFARVVTFVEGPGTPRTETVSDSIPLNDGDVKLAIEARGLEYRFFAGSANGELRQVGEVFHGKIISRQLPGSYSGAYVGMFATSNGDETSNFADFHSFTYKTCGLNNDHSTGNCQPKGCCSR
jgi:xylan 1,4-beta-xylosidase